MSGTRNKEDFLFDEIPGDAMDRIQKVTSNPNRCSAFLMAFAEFHPLFNPSSVHDTDDKNHLVSLVGEQETLVQQIADLWGLDDSSVLQARNRSNLGQLVCELVASRESDRKTEIIDLAGHVEKIIESSRFVSRLIQDMNSEATDDVLVAVKLAIFPESWKFSRMLSTLQFSQNEKNRHLGMQVSVAIELSKDLAYNYDRAGSIWDRERLFVQTLKHSMALTAKTWGEMFSETLPSPMFVMDPCLIAKEMPLLRAAIDDQDMGYDDLEFSRRLLVERIAESIKPRIIPDESAVESVDLRHRVFAARVTRVDEIAAECWAEAAGSLIERIFSMSDYDRQEFMKSEGKRPMNLEEFWDAMESRFHRVKLSPLFSPDSGELLSRSGKHLVSLWGLSDTICKIRGVNT